MIFSNYWAILLCIIVQYPRFCKAQNDTIYINELGTIMPAEQASHYRVTHFVEANNYEINEYSIKHIKRSSGHYTNKAAIIKNGSFVYYNADGNKASEGMYVNGFKNGEWKYYYDEGKKIRELQYYQAPKKEYYSVEFDVNTAVKVNEGLIDAFGKRSGLWKEYHKDGDSIKLISHYSNGRRQGQQLEYYENGKLKRRENIIEGEQKQGELFDEQGKKIKYYPAFVYPKPPESLWRYLSFKVKCFRDLIKSQDMEYNITVEKDGSISNVFINGFDDENCKKEMEKAILSMKKWKAAKWENKACKYTLNGSFRYYQYRE